MAFKARQTSALFQPHGREHPLLRLFLDYRLPIVTSVWLFQREEAELKSVTTGQRQASRASRVSTAGSSAVTLHSDSPAQSQRSLALVTSYWFPTMAPPAARSSSGPCHSHRKPGHGASLQTRLVGIREMAQQLRALADERVVSRLGCGSAGVLGLAGTEPWAGSQHYRRTWRYIQVYDPSAQLTQKNTSSLPSATHRV